MDFLRTGPGDASASVLLAHGAGAPMDAPFMTLMAARLAERGLRTARFEFAYMAGRRTGAGKKAPPRAELLKDEYREAVAALKPGRPLFIGGKSMGGRVASLIAEEMFRDGTIAGLVCLGYPFHPPGRLEQVRTGHLADLTVPALICQGTRDPFGTREEVAGYPLSRSITVHWLVDGDHDFKPRKESGLAAADNLRSAADAVLAWVKSLVV